MIIPWMPYVVANLLIATTRVNLHMHFIYAVFPRVTAVNPQMGYKKHPHTGT